MDVTQLHYFIVTAEEEHITKASEILNLSQSALSRSITSLEKELGVPLFDRKNRNIVLNRFGKIFLEDAKRIVNEIEQSKDKLTQLVHPEVGHISISFVHSLGLNYIPTLLKDFQATNPEHTISLNEDSADLIIKDLLTNETDLGFATQYRSFVDLVYHPIFEENIVLITSEEHRFTKQKQVKMEDIIQEKFIHYHAGTELRKLIDTYFREQDTQLQIAYDGLEIISIIGLVTANMGIALVPESTIQNIKGISIIPIQDFELHRTIYLIHKKEGYISKAALFFKEFTLSYKYTDGSSH